MKQIGELTTVPMPGDPPVGSWGWRCGICGFVNTSHTGGCREVDDCCYRWWHREPAVILSFQAKRAEGEASG